MGTLQLDGKFIVIFILSKVSSSSKNLYIKKPSVTWHGLNQDCQPTCLLRAKCWVMHQGCGKSHGTFTKPPVSGILTKPQSGQSYCFTHANTALLQWLWMRMRSMGCTDEGQKVVASILGKLHKSWRINLPVFYPQTIQNHLVVLHSERWEASLGVLHFLNRKFKMAVIDLTLTMGRLCLFKFMGNSIFP